jgi:rhamnulose-1-phosphate aldolase/alcohol dehydrogenase
MLSRWDEADARGLEGLDELVYRSRLIGAEPGLVLWGGGNTSAKLLETDFRGRETLVLRIKGSGSDLRTIEPRHFPGVRLEDVLPLRQRQAMTDEEMVDYLVRCLIDPASPRPSIETLLHAFLPHPHVDHSHADAILSLTNNREGKKHARAVFGDEMIWIPYRRPGFELSSQVADEAARHPKARAVILEKHGLITWGDSAKDSYETHVEMNTRAEEYITERAGGRQVFGPAQVPPLPPEQRRGAALALMPILRGALAREGRRPLLRFDDGEDLLEFLASEQAPALSQVGPATPDHLMNTRLLPMVLPPPALSTTAGRPVLEGAYAGAVAAAVQRYAASYRDFYDKYRGGDEAMQEPTPRVVLVRGVGMVTAGRDARAARVSADIYHHTVGVMAGAQALAPYTSLAPREAFDVEYWPLELYRQSLLPPERDLARRVAVVTGAAGGIGAAIARRFAEEGAHVVVADLDAGRGEAVAQEIRSRHGEERAIFAPLDITREDQVRAALERTVLQYGGIDILVNNAGIARPSPIEELDREGWERSLAVNATGHFLMTREALPILRQQQAGGCVLFVGSKNVMAPGKEFAAYSASKAAQTQLARVLALEAAAYGVRVNILSPDAVFRDSGLWSEEVRRERAQAHGIRPEEIQAYYRDRNLLRIEVRAEDVAEAALFLASERASRTTGCTLTIDGGVREAFPR